MTEMDGDRLIELMEQGYNFQLCAWNPEIQAVYREKLESMGIEEVEIEYTFSNDGSEAFYIFSSKASNNWKELWERLAWSVAQSG